MCGEGCGQAGQAGQREPRFHLPAFGQGFGEGREEGGWEGGTGWVMGDPLSPPPPPFAADSSPRHGPPAQHPLLMSPVTARQAGRGRCGWVTPPLPPPPQLVGMG